MEIPGGGWFKIRAPDDFLISEAMLFDSPVFFAFLVLVVVVYWRLAFRRQNVFLLVASYFFYGWWDWRFLLLMIGSTTIDYFIAHAIARATGSSRRKQLLILSLIINFSILGVFKYFNFFIGSFAGVSRTDRPSVANLSVEGHPAAGNFLLHVPGSRVHRRRLSSQDRACRLLSQYSLFISLFPHLIAGPIQRPRHLLPQVQRPRTWDAERALDGMILIQRDCFESASSPTTAP